MGNEESKPNLEFNLEDYSKEFDIKAIKECDFPFENLVMEGGGNKGVAYVGALQVLEKLGLDKKIKRICGASVGAIVAALIAVGMDSERLFKYLGDDLEKVFIDHRCGYVSMLPNLLSKFGWNPGNRMLEWFGKHLEDETGDADITFKQVHKAYGRELCVVVTNLSEMTTEYFHPKTTPDMPVRLAVRMSMSLPGLFQVVKHSTQSDMDNIYIDGGFLCNYPIHAFDGWWLSMEKEHSFFEKFQSLSNVALMYDKNERFGGWNEKTFGMLLYSSGEKELMKSELQRRAGNTVPPHPDTKLARQRKQDRQNEEKLLEKQRGIIASCKNFLFDAGRLGLTDDFILTTEEIQRLYKEAEKFSEDDQRLLFDSTDPNEAMNVLDRNADGQVTFLELKQFVQSKGVQLEKHFLGFKRAEIKGLMQYLNTLQTALSVNAKRHYVDNRDYQRTVGINTDYIETTDFKLELGDKDFLVQTGRQATLAFLDYYVKNVKKS